MLQPKTTTFLVGKMVEKKYRSYFKEQLRQESHLNYLAEQYIFEQPVYECKLVTEKAEFIHPFFGKDYKPILNAWKPGGLIVSCFKEKQISMHKGLSERDIRPVIKTVYKPLEEAPKLFIEFGSLDPTNPKQILEFYNKYGPLGLSCLYGEQQLLLCLGHTDLPHASSIPSWPTWIGDWLRDVQNEILGFDHCLRLWWAVNVGVNEDYKGFQEAKKFLEKIVEGSEVKEPFMSENGISFRGVFPFPYFGEQVKNVAKAYILQRVNRYLTGIKPTVIVKEGKIFQGFFFKCLIHAIYFQLYMLITKGKIIRICKNCQKPFIPKRTSSFLCEKCNKKAKYKKYYEAHREEILRKKKERYKRR